MTKIW